MNIINVFQDSVELKWLPPTEPNGEVHYVIYYTPEGGTEQTIDTGSDLTYYNLIGLERNRVYTNIAVQAVNILGRSNRSVVIAPPGKLSYRITVQKHASTTVQECTVLRIYVCTYHYTPEVGELCTVSLFICVYQFQFTLSTVNFSCYNCTISSGFKVVRESVHNVKLNSLGS